MVILLTTGTSEKLSLKTVGEMYFIHNGAQIVRLQNRKINILNTHFKYPYTWILSSHGWSFACMLNQNPWKLKHILLVTHKATSVVNLLGGVLIVLSSGAGVPPPRIKSAAACMALHISLTWVSQEAPFFSCTWQGRRGSKYTASTTSRVSINLPPPLSHWLSLHILGFVLV